MPLRGPQLAYYLKKRNPDLYAKAKEIKEKYGVSWNIAIAIAKGESPPLPPVKTEDLSRSIRDLSERISRVEALVERLEPGVALGVEELKKTIEEAYRRALRIESELALLELSSRERASTCKWISEDGYCTKWALRGVLPGWRVKEENIRGVKICRVSVKEHPLLCLGCLSYMLRERA
jgi:hypothetical protein